MSRSIGHEANAALAIAAREVVLFVREWKEQLTFAFFFPIAFLGIFAGTIGQNLGGQLGYNYLQFATLGMIPMLLVMNMTMSVTHLVEEREIGLTQEMFVSPSSRTSLFLGKILGASVTSLVSLVAVFAVAFAIGVRISLPEMGIILLIAPVLLIQGGAFGVLLSGIFGTSPKAVDQAAVMTTFPQAFLSGAIVPIGSSSGVLYVLVHLMPMTYLVDLLRGAFYHGTPTYGLVVLYSPWVDLGVSVALTVAFFLAGMFLFIRGERNR